MDWKEDKIQMIMNYDYPINYSLQMIRAEFVFDIIYFDISYNHLLFTNCCYSNIYEFSCPLDIDKAIYYGRSFEQGLKFMKKIEMKLAKMINDI